MIQGHSCPVNGFHRYVLTTKEPGDPKTLCLDLWDGQDFLVALHHSPAPLATLYLFSVFSLCWSWFLSPLLIAHETALCPRDAISKKDEYAGSHSFSYDFIQTLASLPHYSSFILQEIMKQLRWSCTHSLTGKRTWAVYNSLRFVLLFCYHQICGGRVLTGHRTHLVILLKISFGFQKTPSTCWISLMVALSPEFCKELHTQLHGLSFHNVFVCYSSTQILTGADGLVQNKHLTKNTNSLKGL